MRRGGLLDGFPIRLFAQGGSGGVTVLIDHPDVGRLQHAPVPDDGGTVVVVSRTQADLDAARAAMAPQASSRIHWVQADPARLPIRDRAVETLIVCGPDRTSTEWRRVLTRTGRLIEITRAPSRADGAEGGWGWVARYRIAVCPGGRYFVIPADGTGRWPFEAIHLSKAETLRLAVWRLLTRLGASGRGVHLVVRCRTAAAPFGRWLAGTDGSRSGSARPDGIGVMVKVGESAALFGAREPGSGGGAVVVKFPLGAGAAARMERQAATLRALHTAGLAPLKDRVPRLVAQGTADGQAYWTETRLGGRPTTEHWRRAGWRRAALTSSVEWLVQLHRETGERVRVSAATLERLARPHAESLEREVRALSPGFDLSPLMEALRVALEGRSVPLVQTHGDFWQGNLLADARGRVQGVLDWDLAVPCGWPLLDLLLLLLTSRNRWRVSRHFGQAIVDRLLDRRLNALERRLVARYCDALDLDPALWSALVALFWLERSAMRLPRIREQRWFRAWVRRSVVAPLPRLVEGLRAELPAAAARRSARARIMVLA